MAGQGAPLGAERLFQQDVLHSVGSHCLVENDGCTEMTTDPRDAEIARLTARAEKAEAALSEAHRQQRDSDKKLRNQRHEINWLRHQQVVLKAALSESQALLAAAFEAAARLCDETADEALEESGPRSRMIYVWFRGQAKAIRALTPADAQAALDARINAAKEEGRVLGLREGVECCTTVIDHNLELSIQTGAYRCKEAILSKIKEAENG